MSNFHIHTQILWGNTLFSGKIYTTVLQILHDRRSRRSSQISSLRKTNVKDALDEKADDPDQPCGSCPHLLYRRQG